MICLHPPFLVFKIPEALMRPSVPLRDPTELPEFSLFRGQGRPRNTFLKIRSPTVHSVIFLSVTLHNMCVIYIIIFVMYFI